MKGQFFFLKSSRLITLVKLVTHSPKVHVVGYVCIHVMLLLPAWKLLLVFIMFLFMCVCATNSLMMLMVMCACHCANPTAPWMTFVANVRFIITSSPVLLLLNVRLSPSAQASGSCGPSPCGPSPCLCPSSYHF